MARWGRTRINSSGCTRPCSSSATSRSGWSTSTSRASSRRRSSMGWRSTSPRGPVPGRDASGRWTGARRGRRLRAPARRGYRRRHAPAAPLRDRQGRAAGQDGGRDVRQGDGAEQRQGRPHAPVRPGAQLQLQRHRGREPAARDRGGAGRTRSSAATSVAVAFFGEGAANQGTFHESLNLAGLWQLPVIFVCEDNSWAISVPKSKSTAIASNADRARCVRDARRLGRAQRRDRGVRGRGGGGRARAARRWTVADRDPDRPLPRPLPGRCRGLPPRGRGRRACAEHDPIPTLARAPATPERCSTTRRTRKSGRAPPQRVTAAYDFARESPLPEPAEALEHVFV